MCTFQFPCRTAFPQEIPCIDTTFFFHQDLNQHCIRMHADISVQLFTQGTCKQTHQYCVKFINPSSPQPGLKAAFGISPKKNFHPCATCGPTAMFHGNAKFHWNMKCFKPKYTERKNHVFHYTVRHCKGLKILFSPLFQFISIIFR